MVNLSEESSDDADAIWQKVATKRRRTESPQQLKQQKRIHLNDQPSTSTNRYAELNTEDDEPEKTERTGKKSEATPKPPAIYIPDVNDINIMIKKINKVIPCSEYNYKSLREGQVRLMVKSVESYRKVINFLETSKINFHTYQLKQERAYRIVIKGLHHSTPPVDIKAELLALGHQVRAVTNVRSRINKEPLSMFFVDLDPDPNNKTVYDIKHINQAIVKIEPPLRTNDFVQCHRCQQYGHTKSYCKNQYRCVKCGMDHATTDCDKSADTPPRCVHCSLNHTASYKGCQVYQNLVARRPTRQRLFSTSKNFNHRENTQFHNDTNNHPNPSRANMSYSEALRGPASNENSRMDRLEKIMENLMNLMSMLMAKLCN